MQNFFRSRQYGAFIATQIALWFIILSTVVGEVYKPFKEILASMTGHHWTSKSLIATILFIVFVMIVPQKDVNANSITNSVVKSVYLGTAILAIFFTLHFLGFI